jgi:hypothetical protein
MSYFMGFPSPTSFTDKARLVGPPWLSSRLFAAVSVAHAECQPCVR